MAPTDDPSNIRVFVHWHDQTIFAGEEIKCTITFKNVATGVDKSKQKQQGQSDRNRLTSSLHARAKASSNSTPPLSNTGRGHRRSALSLGLPPATTRRTGSVQWPSGNNGSDKRPGHDHKRSVSIVSIGSTSTIDDHQPRIDSASTSSNVQRPARGHSRATSLQILPRSQVGSPTALPNSGS